jgi:hypothetical protein
MNNIWLASFDIGKKNFSFYIEEIDKSKLLEIINIPKKQRYCEDGTPSVPFNKILKDVYKNGKKILLLNTDITQNCDQKAYLDTETFFNMTDLLDSYAEYWDKCDAFVIEKQMSFRGKMNTMAMKLGQHCWSYFSFKYSRFKQIIEFPAYHKTQVLGSQKTKVKTKINTKNKYKNITKYKRKKWCVDKAIFILDSRKDEETISHINTSKKKDDLSDVICQLQAFKYLIYVDKKL